ncbi:unnamed protein product [Oikopleura dioica]|uniref:Secreted protein n=1 Tax=Oikopleura dioica TaxID=34765 RepID=E4XYF7_OIKDI|nr:unnamed protein product [Oikopleura dioica]
MLVIRSVTFIVNVTLLSLAKHSRIGRKNETFLKHAHQRTSHCEVTQLPLIRNFKETQGNRRHTRGCTEESRSTSGNV